MSKILVIEDDSFMQNLLCDLLQASGFQTLCANNGRTGLEIVQQCKPDLILSDIRMPEMDGYALLAALRHDLNIATIPIVFFTGEADVVRQLQSKQLRVDDCLCKSVSPSELIGSIQKQLAKQVVNEMPSPVAHASAMVTCPL